MARIPRSFTRRARSMASIFLATPSGSAWACISIAPLRVCAFADSEKTRHIAASCNLMGVPFIEHVSLELGVGPVPKQPLAPTAICQLCYCTTRCYATSECEHGGIGARSCGCGARNLDAHPDGHLGHFRTKSHY